MKAEDLLKDEPIYYKDGNIEMRLILFGPSVCLEWNNCGTWVEVSSMRQVALNAFLEAYDEKNEMS